MRIAIIGVGGHGNVIRDLLIAIGGFEFVGFFDRKYNPLEKTGISVIGSDIDLIDHWREFAVEKAVVAIGDNQIRKHLYHQLIRAGIETPVLVHPRSTVSPGARVAQGTVVCGHSFIGPGTVIGENCIVNTGANVDHDCVLEGHIHVCPGVNLAGGVKVGAGTMIGTGANIIPGIRIGADVIIGAGSTLITDIPDHVTVVGVPGRVISKRTGG